MRGLGKVEASVETPESLDAEAAKVGERIEREQRQLATIDESYEATRDVDERERLRDLKEPCEARLADAKELHSEIVERRDRLAKELALAELDPARERIKTGDELAAWHRSQAATIGQATAALREMVDDAEDAILHPDLSAGEQAEARWFLSQWRLGADLDDHFARLPRRLRKEVRRRMEAIAAALPADVDEYRERARASWEEAGTPLWETQQPIEIPNVRLPDLDAPAPKSPPYARFPR